MKPVWDGDTGAGMRRDVPCFGYLEAEDHRYGCFFYNIFLKKDSVVFCGQKDSVVVAKVLLNNIYSTSERDVFMTHLTRILTKTLWFAADLNKTVNETFNYSQTLIEQDIFGRDPCSSADPVIMIRTTIGPMMATAIEHAVVFMENRHKLGRDSKPF